VQVAVGETLRAAELRRIAAESGRYETGLRPGGAVGDRRIGVVWHTQGSGKSLTMAFYAGRIIREPAMENPTVVVASASSTGVPGSASDPLDWQPHIRAQLRVLVKRILRKHGYPPDKQEKATQTVLEQAEVLSEHWALAAS
jgi:type I restriction enzyme R subunit